MRKKIGQDQLIFLYDRLMVKSEQQQVGLKMTFLSAAECRGNLLHYNDRLKQYLALNPRGHKTVYGGIFLIENYDVVRNKIMAYYNSTTGSYGMTTAQSFFNIEKVKVRPIKFKSLSDLTDCTYEVGEYMEIIAPVMNRGNPRIRKYSNGWKGVQYYHRHRRIDTNNFIAMIEENRKEK